MQQHLLAAIEYTQYAIAWNLNNAFDSYKPKKMAKPTLARSGSQFYPRMC